jgi:DNA-binding MarR family transcriptional regulator
MFYVRELVRKIQEEINAVRRELIRMEKRGMVKKEPRANRIYYYFRKDYVFYDELIRMIAKSVGLGRDIIKNKNKLGKIKFAMLSGKFIKYLPRDKDEVDLLVVGEVVLPELAALVKAEEARRKKEINYTVMSQEEFDFRKRRRDPFILSILIGSRVVLIGNEEELLEGLS